MFQAICPPDGQGLHDFLTASHSFTSILWGLPKDPVGAVHALIYHGSPLVLAEALALLAALTCWIAYLITKNCSHVDRSWSILPPIYVAIFARDDLIAVVAAMRNAADAISNGAAVIPAVSQALTSSGADARLLVAVALSAAWGCRLSYNFWRKGGYNLRFEDYRWPEVRKIMSPFIFEIFNLVFVAFAQHALCLTFTLPAFVATTVTTTAAAYSSSGVSGTVTEGAPPLGPTDWAAVAVFIVLLIGETVADQQQWNFQCRKYELIAARRPRTRDYRRGFRTSGLFRFTRHPNFFCEYGMWWAFYVLCAALTYRCALGWSVAGAVGLTLLFHGGSLWITERISVARYPEYAAYQATTSSIVPWWPGPRLRSAAE